MIGDPAHYRFQGFFIQGESSKGSVFLFVDKAGIFQDLYVFAQSLK